MVVYVVGHKNPDTDSIVCALAMADFLNARDKTDEYKAVRCGELNSETAFLLEKFGIEAPELVVDAQGHPVYLVDHNEDSQIIDNPGQIMGIVDHHKINFAGVDPIECIIKPWGCCSTVIWDLYHKENIPVPKYLKPLLLCAMLSDTVILKSPTATDHDRQAIEVLAAELGLEYTHLGMDLFKAKASVAGKSAEDILANDYKAFTFGGKQFGIGQIETADLSEVEEKISELVAAMEGKGLDGVILMLTDIVEEGSKLVIVADGAEEIAKAFETRLEGNVTVFIPGMLSRKKQVVPVLTKYFG